MTGSPEHRRRNAFASLLANLELLQEVVPDAAKEGDASEIAREAVKHCLRAARELAPFAPAAPDEGPSPPADRHLRIHEVAEHCSSVIWISNPDFTKMEYLNPAFERVWGRPTSEPLEHPERWHEWIHEEDRGRVLAAFLAGTNDTELEYRVVRPDGGVRWVHTRIAPIRRGGEVCGVVGVIDDVTEQILASRREAEALAGLERSVREKQMLLHEVHHRVKNNLQIVSSLLDLQSRFVDDPATRAKLIESRDRVCSMGLIHELLYERDDVSRVDFERYLDRLIDALRDAWVPEGRILVIPRVTAVHLDVDVAVPCALILNEALTNAFRHAFPEGRSGTVCVDLTCGDGQVELIVRDDGVGFPPDRLGEAPTSLGLQLLRSLAQQLGGTLRIEPQDGTTVRVAFPAA